MAAAIYMSIAASTNTGTAQGASSSLPRSTSGGGRGLPLPHPTLAHPSPSNHQPFRPPGTARGQGSAFLATPSPSNQSRDTRVHIFFGG